MSGLFGAGALARSGWTITSLATALALGAATFSPTLAPLLLGALIGVLLWLLPLPYMICASAAFPWIQRLPLLVAPEGGPWLRADVAACGILAVRCCIEFSRDGRADRAQLWLAGFTVLVFSTSLAQAAGIVATGTGWFLYAQPLIILTAMSVLDDARLQQLRMAATRTLLGIAYLQLAVFASQIAAGAGHDSLKGSLVGAGAGHHVAPSVLVIVALVALGRRQFVRASAWFAAAAGIGFIGDSKQVLFATPAALAMLLIGRRVSMRARVAGFVLLAAGLGPLFLAKSSLYTYAFGWIDQTLAGGGKGIVVEYLWERSSERPEDALLGSGAATTVSRLALLAEQATSGSPLGPPREEHLVINREVAAVSAYEYSSFLAPTSSALGLVGDYGLVGLLLYGGTVASVRRRIYEPVGRRITTALFAFGVTLGLVFDWLEQAPFTCAVALAILALCGRRESPVRATWPATSGAVPVHAESH